MSRDTSSDSEDSNGDGGTKKFSTVTRYLRHQDFRWLKEDMGFFDLPENWDMQFHNDRTQRHYPDS